MANAAGWYSSAVTVALAASRSASGAAVLSITYNATGTQLIASTTVAGAGAAPLITAEGGTILAYFATDELDLEIHFPKKGVILSPDSRSLEKFMHRIKVLMAKNYIDILSEEARKGMLEKAEEGIWPTKALLGYRTT